MINLRFVMSLLLCSALAVGCASAASPAATIGPTASPTVLASPTISSAGAASPSAADTISEVGSGSLGAGTHRLNLQHINAGGTKLLPILITVPDGWYGDGWLINRPRTGQSIPPVAVQFWQVGQVYGHPCQWSGTLFQPGPTVADLAKALAERPTRNATRPIDVTLDGYKGKYLEWSVPTDLDFSACDADGGTNYFESWTGFVVGSTGDRYQQGAGQLDRLWILDVGGARLVIDGFSMPTATTEERQELVHVIEGLRFEG